jgi:hypothetical protein
VNAAVDIAAVKKARMRLIVFRFYEGRVGAEAAVVLEALADELAFACVQRHRRSPPNHGEVS